MKVLVDTSVWSLALRRQASQATQNEKTIVSQLKDLIRENLVVMIGPVRQELLSGLRDESSFAKLQSHLASFPDKLLVTEDYEEAARCHNQCRSSGIAGSSVDMLIRAVAIRRTLTIFTTDEDFQRYAEILDFKLHESRSRQALLGKLNTENPLLPCPATHAYHLNSWRRWSNWSIARTKPLGPSNVY